MSKHADGAKEVEQLLKDGGVSDASTRLQDDINKMTPADWNKFCDELKKLNESDRKLGLPVVELIFADKDGDGKTDIDMVSNQKNAVAEFNELVGIQSYKPNTRMTPGYVPDASIITERARVSAGAKPVEQR